MQPVSQVSKYLLLTECVIVANESWCGYSMVKSMKNCLVDILGVSLLLNYKRDWHSILARVPLLHQSLKK